MRERRNPVQPNSVSEEDGTSLLVFRRPQGKRANVSNTSRAGSGILRSIGLMLLTLSSVVSSANAGGVQRVQLNLPEVVYAVPGIESNIYFDNVLLVVNPDNFIIDVDCSKGIQQSERWTYTPTNKDVGTYQLTLKVLDADNTVVATGKTVIRVASSDSGKGKKVSMLMIGDSLTHASIYSQHILDLCRPEGNPGIRLIGSHCPTDAAGINRHEGYGGWRAEMFATRFTGIARKGNYRKRGSPFLYQNAEGKARLDFARYCREFNNGNAPDIVTIFLGANDVYHATDATIDEYVERMLKYYDQLIAMIRHRDKATKIGIMLPVPPAASQDAFGANAGCGQTRWQYKRNIHHLVERMMKKYGHQEGKNIYLVPTHVNLDCVHNYPSITTPSNARTDKKVTRLNNAVHPSAPGYKQIGDSLYCWIKSTF